MQSISDEELVEFCKKQVASAQSELYDRYSALLYTQAYRILKDSMLAEDIMQETFLAFFYKTPELKYPGSVKYYLKKVATNKSITAWRKNKKIDFREIEYLEEVEEEEKLYSFEQVKSKMNNLPEKYRIALELFYFQELSHEEIAESLEISVVNSRVILKRAKEKLKEELK